MNDVRATAVFPDFNIHPMPNITIGTVETLETGEDATATMTGTKTNPVLNLGLPRGPQGEQGAAGPRGLQGPQGEKGEKGDKGDTGNRGPQGPQGIQGPQGEKGDKGDTGATGPQGPRGYQGEQGQQGVPGRDGRDGNNKVFIAEYDVTSYETIKEAYDDGYQIYCKKSDNAAILPLKAVTSPAIIFAGVINLTTIAAASVYSNSTWGWSSKRFQNTENLVTSVDSSSTDTQYPSAKCVYELMQGAGGGSGDYVLDLGDVGSLAALSFARISLTTGTYGEVKDAFDAGKNVVVRGTCTASYGDSQTWSSCPFAITASLSETKTVSGNGVTRKPLSGEVFAFHVDVKDATTGTLAQPECADVMFTYLGNEANAGGILVLQYDSETGYLDKTAVEIVQFAQTGIVYLPVYSSGVEGQRYLYYTLSMCVIENESEYTLLFHDPVSGGDSLSFWAETGTDYPVLD